MTEVADCYEPESGPSFGSLDVSKKLKFLELYIEFEFIPSSWSPLSAKCDSLPDIDA